MCTKCEVLNFSDSFFFSELIELENQNRFEPLSRKKGDKSPSPDTTSFVKGLKFWSININGIISKILELLAFLDAHQPHVVLFQKQRLTAQLQRLNCSQKHLSTVCTEKIEISWWRGDATYSQRHLSHANHGIGK